MTNGKTQETEETCGHQIKEENISRAGNLNLRGSFTTLSTIAIQTGRSQIVVSVLQSGSAVHLQLVQIQPGLCEIGSNQEENQILIQDQQQLLDKLQKHEPEVLAAVEKKGKEKPRMRRDGRMTEQKRKQEEEEELKQAMKASLSEGWSLLCRLLKRRLEVLTLTSDFYHRAAEFAVSIDRFEALQIKADEDRLTEVQRSFDSMRKDLLLKSLKVLSSSSVLLQKLRQLQRTEALQRRGGVLQEEEEEEKSSQSSSGAVLRLEELVEKLQDRRQRADQVIRLQLQQAEKVQKTKLSGPHDQNLLDQNLQSGAVSADVQSESRSDQTRNSESEGTSEKFKSGSTSDLQVEFRSDQKPTTQSEGTRNLDLQFGSRSQQGGALQSGSRLDTKPELHLDLESDLDRNRDQKSESRLDGTKNQQSGLKPFMFRNLQHGSRSTPQSDSSSKETKNLSLCSRSDLKCKSASGETRNLKSRFRSGETTQTRLEVETVEPVSEKHHRSRSEKTRDLQSESRSTESKDLQSGSRLDQQTDSGSQETEDSQSGFRSDLKSRSKSEVPGSRSGMMLESQERTDLRPECGSDQIRKQQLESRLVETKGLQSSFKSVLKTRTSSIVKPGSPSEETGDQESCSRSEVSGSELNLLSEQQQTMQRHSQTKQDVNKLKTHHKAEIQQEQEDLMFSRFSRKYQQRLVKTLQDLNLVLELLDSCTLVDLGSELQTYRLLEHFKQAEPHFKKLDAEVDFTLKSWEHLRGVQAQLEDVEAETERDEDPSELLKLQQTVKNKIQQSEVILNLTRNFHLTANQLELLVQSGLTSSTAGSTGLCGPSEADLSRHLEAKQQIQNLLKTVSTLKTDICAAVTRNGWTGFQVEQLEVRLHALNSLCTSWLNEAARHEEKLHREQLTHLLHDDVIQLRDSFKELKKRFSNMKFNYLKRNDRMRNLKAVRNQLQQVEVYEEKLQALRNRLQGVTTRLESEVKDGGVARQVEDATNELQRQMGEFERSVCEHQKTLDMICRLQQALEEYQFWCEEASATITRVGKFSLECRSTEAVSVLYRQFEKFVWPTVPQQEERISQITELAVRLHGVEEGQRYIEKTVSKHSEMVESIRELSNGLMELEAKLKLESLKQQQSDEKKEVKEEESEQRKEKEMEKKERKVKEKKKMKLMEPKDNRSTQEAADMYELKETGHTPELTAEHDGKEAAAANRKLEESQEADRQTAESESSFSCSPLEVNQPAVTLQSQSQHVAAEPQATPPQTVTDPAFADFQNPFQKDKQAASTFCGSNLIPPQDASAHAEPHQHETTMEDFFSNDEYDCASPDDISLPPLAETPESIMFQSDVEESFCFSSHSVHISHVSHQCLTQAEQTGTGSAAGVVPQHRESGLTEDGPVPSVSRHSNTRFRSESRSYLQSPSTAPAPRLFSSTLCTVLKTRESSTNNIPQTADPSLGSPEPGLPYRSNSVSGGIKQGRSKDNDVSKRRSSSLSTLQDLSQSPQRFSGPDPDIHNSPAGDAGFHKFSPHFIQNNSVISKNNSTVVVHKDTTCPQDDSPEASEITLQSTATLEEMSPPQLSTGAWSGLNQEAPSIQTSEKTSSSSTNSHLTTAVPQETRFCGSFPSDRLETPSKRDATDQTEEHSSPQPNSITICSSKRSLQTVSSVHESLTFTQAQQRVHGPGMSPSSPAQPAAPSQPEAQAQALADLANLHVTPPSSSPHLLTSPQDPDICQPVAICEEIRLTPQIQGPPLPPPPPHGQAESLLLGKPSRPGPPCFTRPLSQATVMEGSPVTLEVEVMGNPEPELTWFTSGDESIGRPAPAPPSVESESPSVDLAPPPGELSLPSVGADHPTSHHDSRQLMERSGGDKWLVVEVFDIMSEDWNSWFGTLCVLLWLLYLIIV